MPQVGESKTINGVTGTWDGTTWRRSAAAPAPESNENGLAPSGESVAGSFLGGWLGPAGSALGSAIGSAAHELSGSLPKLWAIGRGPMSSEGVGGAMGETAGRIARDVGVNAAMNHAPGIAAKALKGAGGAMTKFGASEVGSAPAWKRAIGGAVVDPLLHTLGIPAGVAEGVALAAPPVARVAGPIATKVGNALPSTVMEGLVSAAGRMKPGLEEPVPESAVVRETVNTAKDLEDGGMSHAQAGQRAGWPLGTSTATDVSHPTAEVVSPGELFPYQTDAIAGLRAAAKGKDPNFNGGEGDPELAGSQPYPKAKSPIEEFYQNDPQARTGGEGRMTGQFIEGDGGLSDITAGNFTRYPSPNATPDAAPLDSRISGLTPDDAASALTKLSNPANSANRLQELMRQFGGLRGGVK